MPIRPACFALLLALCATAHAREVYKCTNAQGDVAFQDKPCARDAKERRVHIADESEYAPAPCAGHRRRRAAAATADAARRKPPSKPLPPLWLCMNAEDGSRYISRNGAPPPRLVPLGALGYPRQDSFRGLRARRANRHVRAGDEQDADRHIRARIDRARATRRSRTTARRPSPEQTCDVPAPAVRPDQRQAPPRALQGRTGAAAAAGRRSRSDLGGC